MKTGHKATRSNGEDYETRGLVRCFESSLENPRDMCAGQGAVELVSIPVSGPGIETLR